MLAAATKGVWEVLGPVWWLAVVGAAASLIATPILRYLAYRLGVVDRPDAALKTHGRTVAYLGGIAMCVGLLAGLACLVMARTSLGPEWSEAFSTGERGVLAAAGGGNPLLQALAIALGGIIVTVVGLMDDLRDIRPRQKVAGQVLAAGVLLLGGVGHSLAGTLLHPLLGPLGLTMPIWVSLPISALACIVLVVAATNATNLLDGLDGLCGGVTGIIAVGFVALAVHLAMYNTAPGIDALRVGLSLAMAGAVIGFLPYNLPPATIFMGDAGSMLLGFFVAAMLMLFCEGEGGASTTPRWFVAAVAVFGLPILDTALAVVRRARAGRSIFHGDRSHLYDQLVDRGMTVKQVVVLFYLLAAVWAALGVAAAIYLRGRYAVAIYAVLIVVIAWVFARFGMISPPSSADQNGGASSGGGAASGEPR